MIRRENSEPSKLPDSFGEILGMMGWEELHFIYRTVREHAASQGQIVNLGVFMGKSAMLLCEATSSDRVIGIDNWCMKMDYGLHAGRKTNQAGTEEYCKQYGYFPTLYTGDSRTPPDFIDEVAVMFIDSKHTAEHLKEEYNNWLPFLRKDAVVLLHDYGDFTNGWTKGNLDKFKQIDEYSKAIDELFKDWHRLGLVDSTIAFKRK